MLSIIISEKRATRQQRGNQKGYGSNRGKELSGDARFTLFNQTLGEEERKQ